MNRVLTSEKNEPSDSDDLLMALLCSPFTARDMAHMNRLERSGYIDIIMAQIKFGHLSTEQIGIILRPDFDAIWKAIEIVLVKDQDGKYYLEWIEFLNHKLVVNSTWNDLHKALLWFRERYIK